ncbi:hypothetical protein PZB75_11530 [Streptomyces sp. AM 4-1-1]|uniref:hypothetical protein n=1 Tax=unclassified Streptomyces TaxID=2593676 RepID=UPI0023BA0B54|nr:hypothetical protein [Streptomyces sp. AM 4-1-1]WEH33944.1 hypothetical protein PZB75_11530 [Streptomyces sp. AM 4-1-1]
MATGGPGRAERRSGTDSETVDATDFDATDFDATDFDVADFHVAAVDATDGDTEAADAEAIGMGGNADGKAGVGAVGNAGADGDMAGTT